MTHPIARALRRLRAWRESRYWSPRRQLEHLRALVDLDARWLAHDRAAAALTARYGDALAPDWFRRPFEDVGTLRDRIGLNPYRRAADPKTGSISAADLERLRKELQDAADVAVTASNQAVRYLRERDAARTDLQRETRRADYLRRQLDTIAEQNAELRRMPNVEPVEIAATTLDDVVAWAVDVELRFLADRVLHTDGVTPREAELASAILRVERARADLLKAAANRCHHATDPGV